PIFEIGLLGVIAAGLFAWLADDDRDFQDEGERQSKAEEAIAPVSKKTVQIFPTPALWAFFLAASFAFSLRDFAGGAMATSASLFLQKAHAFDPKLAGMALSGIFLASAISNPLFGRLSDGGRGRWVCLVLSVAAIFIGLFPRLGVSW